MDEIDTNQSVAQPATSDESTRNSRRWLIGAAALALAVTGGLALAQGEAPRAADQWSEDRDAQAAASPVRAEAATAIAAPVSAANEARGVIRARDEATIASRITARITALPVGEGRWFSKGTLLARFDCSQAEAQLRAANAATAAYRRTYETNVELDQYKAIGKNEVAVSQANLGKASAEAGAVAAQLSDCAVYAPFSGTVVEEIGHVREIAASGQPLLKIQSSGALEIELIAPSRWLTWMKPGTAFRFKIDETGHEVRGSVVRFASSVDAVSKTIRVTANLTDSAGMVLPGMSGSAFFDQPRQTVAVQNAAVQNAAAQNAAAQGAVGRGDAS